MENLSYKQLQEELKKAREQIKILEKVIEEIQKIVIGHIKTTGDIPMIIISDKK